MNDKLLFIASYVDKFSSVSLMATLRATVNMQTPNSATSFISAQVFFSQCGRSISD